MDNNNDNVGVDEVGADGNGADDGTDDVARRLLVLLALALARVDNDEQGDGGLWMPRRVRAPPRLPPPLQQPPMPALPPPPPRLRNNDIALVAANAPGARGTRGELEELERIRGFQRAVSIFERGGGGGGSGGGGIRAGRGHDVEGNDDNVNARLPAFDSLFEVDDQDGDNVLRIDHRMDGDVYYFRRFVALLGCPDDAEKGGGHTPRAAANIRRIVFNVDWTGLPDDDMVQLFGTVLPHHATTVQEIGMDAGRLAPRFFRMLTESIPTTTAAAKEGSSSSSITKLAVMNRAINPQIQDQVVRAMEDMLRRNTSLETVVFIATLESDQCRRICRAVPFSGSLASLRLRVTNVLADTLEGLAESKSLRRLDVTGSFSHDAIPSLARQLRTNATLRELTIHATGGNGLHGSHEVFELALKYNWTLETLNWSSGSGFEDERVWTTFREIRRRTHHFQKVLHRLEQNDCSTPSRPRKVLLPTLLGMGIDVPTYVYRVLKKCKDDIGSLAGPSSS